MASGPASRDLREKANFLSQTASDTTSVLPLSRMSDNQAPGDTLHLPARPFGLNRKFRLQCSARSRFTMNLRKPQIEGLFQDSVPNFLFLVLCLFFLRGPPKVCEFQVPLNLDLTLLPIPGHFRVFHLKSDHSSPSLEQAPNSSQPRFYIPPPP